MARRSLKVSLALTVIALLAFSGACRTSPPPPTLRTTRMTLGGKQLTLEVADNDDTREYGLMKRDSMPADHGMIFVFPDERSRSFWMKNTRFPLDIIYISAAGKVVSVHSMRAYDLTPISSAAPAKYDIELNEGNATTLGVHAGDQLSIPNDARDPAR